MRDNIIDTSKPSAGRIYDYLLGGSHNFEVDRQAADQMIAMLPYITKFARLQRWSLQDIAAELTVNRGFDVLIDFASGLPTSDHIHHAVAKGATVIYSDIDPVVVEYAREILKGTPEVFCFQNDASRPEELLENPEVQAILAGRRKVAFGYWGFTSFLTDGEIAHSLRVLYDWAAPGSCLAYNAQAVVNESSPAMLEALAIYERMGAPFFVHSLEKHRSLLQDWVLEEPGFISLLDWHGFDQTELGQEDRESFGPFGGGYGAYLTRR